MILYASPPSSAIFPISNASQQAKPRSSSSNCAHQSSPEAPPFPPLFCHNHSCLCGRRRFIEAVAATSLLPLSPSMASSNSSSDYVEKFMVKLTVVVELHKPLPDGQWIELTPSIVLSVGEAIPLADASVDAVVGTLVLCSVSNVDTTLKGITFPSL